VLQQVFARLGTEWHQFTAVPNEFVADGDTVVALGNYSGTYKGTGKSFTAPFVHVWKFRGAKVARFQQHTDTVLVQAAMR
jgi:ketosteroid isomerase-like protein